MCICSLFSAGFRRNLRSLLEQLLEEWQKEAALAVERVGKLAR